MVALKSAVEEVKEYIGTSFESFSPFLIRLEVYAFRYFKLFSALDS